MVYRQGRYKVAKRCTVHIWGWDVYISINAGRVHGGGVGSQRREMWRYGGAARREGSSWRRSGQLEEATTYGNHSRS